MEKITEKLIKDNVGLILKIAESFYGVDKSDLFQAGALGLIKAYRNYRKNNLAKFSTYAYEYIFGEMYVLANNKELKVSKDLKKLSSMIEQGRNRLMQKLERVPNNHELALFLGIDENKMVQALLSSSKTISLDDYDSDKQNLHEKICQEEKVSTFDKILLNDCVESLAPVEKKIIRSRYFKDLTQSETAQELGLTQVMVSRYEAKSLKKMHDYMYM